MKEPDERFCPSARLRSYSFLAAGDRTRALRGIDAPTVDIHGMADRLVAPSGGRATAAAIPGARLELIEGMGHDLPRAVWPRVIDAIPAPVPA